MKKSITAFKLFLQVPLYFIYLPILFFIYLISPIILIKFSPLRSSRIGPFASTTELYLCERDAGINQPKKNYLDLFYLPYRANANEQLAKMFKRSIKIYPEFLMTPFYYLNKFISIFFYFSKKHDISHNSVCFNNEHDIYNLLENSKPHIEFTLDEEKKGKEYLNEIGLKQGDKFVCIIARDQAYLNKFFDGDTVHTHRNVNIDNFILAAEELTKRGYFVIRMGKAVVSSIKSKNPKIIDYAMSNKRNDFLDVYLGAKCFFCLSSHTGFDNIPVIFRKPVAYISIPIASFFTHNKDSIVITRHHYSIEKKRNLTLSEIVSSEIARNLWSSVLKQENLNIAESSSQDIKNLSIEITERLEGNWKDTDEDIRLQKKFWEIYSSSPFTSEFTHDVRPVDLKASNKLHGKIKIRFGTKFLKNNIDWLN